MTKGSEDTLLARITSDPSIFGGRPVIRGQRLLVQDVLIMLVSGDSVDDLLRACPWLERADVAACLVFARRLVAHQRVDSAAADSEE